MSAHTFVYTGFVVLPIVMAILIAWGSGSGRFAVSILTWMLIAVVLAQTGVLGRFSATPPPIGLFLITGLVATIAVGRSRWSERLVELPLGVLIGAQAFRILVEILIHESSRIGLAAPQMTWDGYNFDIVTGITALALAPFARVAPKWLILVWNCMGLALLLWVVGVAALSFPTRFQLLRPDNTWVAYFPYVWLPSVLVTAALLGHVVLFRKLAARHNDLS
jgi:hypothetical protein